MLVRIKPNGQLVPGHLLVVAPFVTNTVILRIRDQFLLAPPAVMAQRSFLPRGIKGLSVTDLRIHAPLFLCSLPFLLPGLGTLGLIGSLLLGNGSRCRFQFVVFLTCLWAFGWTSNRGPVLADLDYPIILGDLQAHLGIIGLCRCLGCRLFPSIPIGFCGFSRGSFLLGSGLGGSPRGHPSGPLLGSSALLRLLDLAAGVEVIPHP